MAGKLTDDEAVRLAKVFLTHGANIDGDKDKDEGTPLLAAASLHAEQVGIFYIDYGADVHYTYKKDGASALHWAAFCGRDQLVERLIKSSAAIDEPDTVHQSTPTGWALHALMTNDKPNTHHQVPCIKLLLKAGANTEKLNEEAMGYLKTLAEADLEFYQLLK
jgi:ankyrin repeat protein